MRPARAIWLVATREFRERARTRSFRAWTIGIVIIAAGLVAGAQLLPDLIEDDPARLGVLPSTSITVRDALRSSSDQLGIPVQIAIVDDVAAGEAAVRSGELDAVLLGDDGQLLFDREERTSLTAVVNRAIQVESLPRRLAALGLTLDEARPLIAPEPVAVALLDPPTPGEVEETPREERYFAATASAALLYVALAVYGGFVLNGVIEEKSNRVVEVLLGALRPSDLLAGKVLGILATALVQLLAGLGGVAVALLAVGHADIPDVAIDVVLYGVAWFLLGLTFYNFAYAAVGATVSRPAEAQNAAWPVTMLLLVPYMLAIIVVPTSPDGILARVLSIFPLTAPLVMPSRVAIGHPALWEVVLSFALMLPAIVGMIWLAGRIYRAVILRTGPRVQLLQALRAARRG